MLSDGSLSVNHYPYKYDNSELYYKLNDGDWVEINVNSGYHTDISVNVGDTVLFKGLNCNNSNSSSGWAALVTGTARQEFSGNILSLMFGDDFIGKENTTPPGDCKYRNLFEGNTGLVSAKNLMFKVKPDDSNSLREVFRGCTSLTTSPRLSAGGYDMFDGCTNLNYIYCNEVDQYTIYLDRWVHGVAANGIFVKHPDANWERGENGIPTGWQVFNAIPHELTIAPTPADATVTINGVTQTHVLIAEGDQATWSVSKPGYTTKTGTYTMGTNDYTLSVSLELAPNHTVTIIPNPADAVVTINGQVRSSYTTYEGDTITWNVGKTGYISQNGTFTLTKDTTLPITLEEYTDYSQMPFTVKALESGTIMLRDLGVSSASFWYNFNNTGWVEFTRGLTTNINVNENDTIQIKGIKTDDPDPGSGSGSGSGSNYNINGIVKSDNCNYEIYGNILSLLYKDDFIGKENEPIGNDIFDGFVITQNKLISAKHLILPNVTSTSCYSNMFQGCTSLTTAPALPATTLAEDCYCNMFRDCTSLTTAPALPATTLAQGCYCIMFQGCTSLTTAPELPATTLADYCYHDMFAGCTSLTTAPVLPATDETQDCYRRMFTGCTSLNYVECLLNSPTWEGDNTHEWLKGVSPTGTFVRASRRAYWDRGESGIPEGWTMVPPESSGSGSGN